MTTVQPKSSTPVKNENLKNLKPIHGKTSSALPMKKDELALSPEAKAMAANPPAEEAKTPTPPDASAATSSATKVASALSKIPVLPIVTSTEAKVPKKIEDKINESPAKLSFIKKPAVIFIEGFSAFGISNGDGIKDMAEGYPGAKLFSWNEQDKIVEEIKKHSPEQPVVLVGHSFGGDSAVEIANTLNSVKNGFRSIDLLVSIDSVGMNHSIIPMNVKRNLNFFGEGVVPFLHGDPTVARNTDYTEVVNELRSELHSKMEDSQEVQFKIFESINEAVTPDDGDSDSIFIEIQKYDQLKDFIHNQSARLKP